MLKNIADFARGFVLGLVLGGAAGILLAPATGEETQSRLEARIEAAKAAYERGRAQAERELWDYFEQAKRSSTEGL